DRVEEPFLRGFFQRTSRGRDLGESVGRPGAPKLVGDPAGGAQALDILLDQILPSRFQGRNPGGEAVPVPASQFAHGSPFLLALQTQTACQRSVTGGMGRSAKSAAEVDKIEGSKRPIEGQRWRTRFF